MAIKSFVVESYELYLGSAIEAAWGGADIKARGVVRCHGGDHDLIAYFLTDNSPVPPPTYIVAHMIGATFLLFRDIQPFVDLLRHEKPVTAYLNSDNPALNQIFTSREPIG